ncbi:MAG: glycosyltransferase family 4 protein [Ilumatobacter sp.]|uniref:glycosyltransferase family 4 protein n=1 Tax=Ilumatobacter sp. TaxID=1967498 RepID=UPI00260C72C3|nr:glycosyltransferase family 4 protein [Ilumatobacter sp.]MDJ0768706.1 glycosyltransferase family 4 protein [Ilumatobacter sp.]
MTSIMLASTASNIGGMERVVCGLARGLSAAGAEVRTFFPEDDNADELRRWCLDQGVDAEIHPAVLDAAAPHSPGSARALRQLVRDVDPDIVNLHYGDNFLSLWDVLGTRGAGLRRPVVASIHHPTEWTGESRRKRLMTALGARVVNQVTTFAGATRTVLREAGVPPGRITVIPCGVDVPTTRIDRDSARRALAIDDDVFVVGTLARLVEYKGVDKLIDAMDCEPLADTILVVGGTGPVLPQLEDQAASAEHVDARFVGRLEDVGALFAACDLFALPSRLEGFGLVYVEAAMYGVPSIATDVGGVSEAVRDGETGRLIRPDDVAALRSALVELRTDDELRARLGRAAEHRAVNELDEATMVRRYAELFAALGAAGAADLARRLFRDRAPEPS